VAAVALQLAVALAHLLFEHIHLRQGHSQTTTQHRVAGSMRMTQCSLTCSRSLLQDRTARR
jgi:hypothetical protein